VALDEVPGLDDEALRAREPGCDPEEQRCDDPDGVLHAPSGDPPDEHEQRRRQVVRDDAQDRGDLGDRGAIRVHPRVEQHDSEVAETEGEPVALVCGRYGDGDDEEPAHPSEQKQSKAQEIRRDRIRQPRVAVVHPPDHGEHHDDVDERRHPPAGDEDAGQLRDREDEDQVEEELERGDARAPVDGLLGHVEIISEPAAAAGAAGQTAAPLQRPQRREKVTLTVADVSCWPGTTGVAESAAALVSRYSGSGEIAPASTIVVIAPSERFDAFASASALSARRRRPSRVPAGRAPRRWTS
jgi:hypothetical protein